MKDFPKRILVVRTDRIGDVILTTPALRALRLHFPEAYIVIMVVPQTRELVEGNPYIDEVIVYDKKNKHKGLFGFWRFIVFLRQRHFDVAINFHTKKRTNLMCFLSGIPRRIGYHNNKWGFLLTDRLPDTRPQGEKHEAQYCLDVLKPLGVQDAEVVLFCPIQTEAEVWADKFLQSNGINESKALIVVHPGASCISKRWPSKKFSTLINALVQRFEACIVLIGGEETKEIAETIKKDTSTKVLDLTSIISLSQLASLLKRAKLLISNDSGPVHMASAVGTPVISIFGRNQAGLSPTRWRPLGRQSFYLHKEVGCEVCLAHNCQLDFKCLEVITVKEVLDLTESILTRKGSV